MSTYYVNEAVFDVPFETFRDRSVTLLEGKLPNGSDISFGIQRGEYEPGQSLVTMVDNHTSRAARALRAHSVIWKKEREVQGFIALDLACRWRNGREMIYTRQTFIDVRGQWMLVSVNGKVRDQESIDEMSQRTISTLRFRE
jgi:hypothetical protein